MKEDGTEVRGTVAGSMIRPIRSGDTRAISVVNNTPQNRLKMVMEAEITTVRSQQDDRRAAPNNPMHLAAISCNMLSRSKLRLGGTGEVSFVESVDVFLMIDPGVSVS